MVISGGARGVDTIAKNYAQTHEDITYKEFLPEWKKYGKRAGILRNRDIVDAADIVVAFWDGKSAGTNNSIQRAKRTKKDCRVYIRTGDTFTLQDDQVFITNYLIKNN